MADHSPKPELGESPAPTPNGVPVAGAASDTVAPNLATDSGAKKGNLSTSTPRPFRFRDQILLGSACAIAIAFMVAYCVRTSRWGRDPIELERQPRHELDYKIELN